MDRGFPACGYLLQRYLQRFYEGFYKFAHTRERACPYAQAHTRTHTKTKTLAVELAKATFRLRVVCLHLWIRYVPPRGGRCLASLAPQGRQAPLETAPGRVFSPPEGGATPPSKNGTSCPFLPAHPPGGCRPPLVCLSRKENFSRSEGMAHGGGPKDEVFLRNGQL